jgi:glucosamine-6-phosphate deaminase
MLKQVTLDAASRAQQVNEGHFPSIDKVPATAITVTCSGLLRARSWICCVPESRKAKAVQRALEGEISTECPASIVRSHENTLIFLDRESAAMLSI